MLDLLYAGAVRWRRRAVERHPDRCRRLTQPVISVGNLSVGGTGKTPVVAAVTRVLIEQGERPAILSRGYRRREPMPGVVVVSDGREVKANLARSGDEPLMLARTVPGAIVCVAEERYLAGVLAERVLGATVHVLDDGFQHLGLARDLDVLVTTPGEIPNGRVLPFGRLREPADAATRAHLLVLMGADEAGAAAEASALGVTEACGGRRRLGAPRDTGTGASPPPGSRVLLVAGIAHPQRFADDLRAVGWNVVAEMWFADHHPYTARDLMRIQDRLVETGAEAVFITEKDAVRLEAIGPVPFPLYAVPLTVEFDPPTLLFDRIATVLRARREGRRTAPSAADGNALPPGGAS